MIIFFFIILLISEKKKNFSIFNLQFLLYIMEHTTNDDEYIDNISDSAQTDTTVSTETSKKKRRRAVTDDKTDIWLYFNKLEPPKLKHKKGSCNVEIKTSKDVKICGHIINTDG